MCELQCVSHVCDVSDKVKAWDNRLLALREDYESSDLQESEEESEWAVDDPAHESDDSDYEPPDRLHVMTCDGMNTHRKVFRELPTV